MRTRDLKRSVIAALALCLLIVPVGLATTAQPGAAQAGIGVPTPPGLPTQPTSTGPTPTAPIGVPTPPGLPTAPTATGPAPTALVGVPTPPPTVAIPTTTLPTPVPVAPTPASPTPGGSPTTSATPAGSATPTGTGTPTATACPTGTATGTPPGTVSATTTATACATAPATVTAPALARCTPTKNAGPLARANIAGEDIAKRTRTSRTFDTGKGNRQTIIAAGALNYQDAKGKWQPIDDTLVPATASGYAFQNKENGYTLALPADLGATPVKVTRGGASVSFALVGAHGGGTTCGPTRTDTYANALPGVNLAYTADSEAVRETLTLGSAAAPSTYTFTVQMSAGLTARANSAGGIDFVDGAGAVQLAFAAPVMFDSAKPRPNVSHAVSLRLATAPGGTTVAIVADAAWLKDPARKYPVVIDPDVIPFPFLATSVCTLASDRPSDTLCSGRPAVRYKGNGSIEHMLVNFGIGGVFNTNVVIQSATVSAIYAGENDSGGDPVSERRAVWMYRMIQAWDGSVSWNRASRTNDTHWSNHDGGNADLTVENKRQVPDDCGDGSGNVGVECTWDATTIAQGWISGAYEPDGLLFQSDSAIASDVDVRFYGSRDAAKPFLTVNYQEPATGGGPTPDLGKRPFYTLATGMIDDRMSAGVNVVSGNLVVSAHDLAIAGTGLSLSIDRYYNSLALYKGAFGNHWAMGSGADLFLITFPAPTNDVVLQGNTGYQTTFKWNGSAYTTPPGMDATLVKNGDGTFTLTAHASGGQQRFDATGKLTALVDRNGNTITYTYNGDGTLQKIVDTQNREVDFTYGVTGKKYVTLVHDVAGNRNWTYHYAGDNLDYSIDANNTYTYYYYNADGNLNRVHDPNGNDTSFGYQGGRLHAADHHHPAGVAPADGRPHLDLRLPGGE